MESGQRLELTFLNFRTEQCLLKHIVSSSLSDLSISVKSKSFDLSSTIKNWSLKLVDFDACWYNILDWSDSKYFFIYFG